MKPVYIETRCISCNKCLEVCTGKNIEKIEGKYYIQDHCLECGQCVAICPKEAIDYSVPTIPVMTKKFTGEEIENFLCARRSTRIYKKDPISEDIIKKLINVATYAPSGCNCQSWEFSVITNPGKFKELKEKAYIFYSGVIKQAEEAISAGKEPGLNEKGLSLLKFIVENYKEARDTLFYEAPLLVVIHSDKNAVTPQDNCCYALYNMIISAHSMGIGSCINGLIIIALNGDKTIRESIGIPEDNQAYTAATFGYPLYEYKRIPKRNDPIIKWF